MDFMERFRSDGITQTVDFNAGKYSTKRKRDQWQGDDAVLQFLKYTVGRDNIPQTIGLVTDGTTENDIPHDYAESVCQQFEILGASGFTVLVATGIQPFSYR